MKIFFIAAAALILIAGPGVAQEKEREAGESEKKHAGVSIGIDYYSTYLWRGTKFFNGDGAFYPKVSWSVFDTGLSLSVASEIAASWVFNGFSGKPGRYSLMFDSSGNLVRKSLNFNHLAYATQSLDFGADYSYTIRDAVTIGAGVWYWWYFNSRYAREYARSQVDGLNRVSYVDISFVTMTCILGLPVVPYINPVISVTYDYYTGLKRGGDYYAQIGLSHPFELIKEVALTIGFTAGYYLSKSVQLTHYNVMWNPAAGALDTTPGLSYSGATRTITLGGIKQTRTPLKKGFSDLAPSIALTFSQGPLSLNGGFFWVIVPSKSWYNGSEIHRLYAKVGIAYSL